MRRLRDTRAFRLALFAARETRDNILDGFGTFAAAVAISACCTLFLALILSFRGNLGDVLDHYGGMASLRVYVYGVDDRLTSLVGRYLDAHPHVESVEFTGREEIARRVGQILADMPGLLDEPDPAGLFDAYDVHLKEGADDAAAEDIARYLSRYREIEVDRPGRELHRFLSRASRASEIITWFFFLLTCTTFFFASAGLTRLATEYAREEVAVQTMVGANRRLILAPFVAEGVFHGLLGIVGGFLLFFAVGTAAYDSVNALLRDVFAYPSDFVLARASGFLLAGIPALFSAAAGSAAVLTRFHPARGGDR